MRRSPSPFAGSPVSSDLFTPSNILPGWATLGAPTVPGARDSIPHEPIEFIGSSPEVSWRQELEDGQEREDPYGQEREDLDRQEREGLHGQEREDLHGPQAARSELCLRGPHAV